MRARAVDHVVLDVDDVLVIMDVATPAAEEAMLGPLGVALGPTLAAEVLARFRAAYGVLIAQLRSPAGAVAPGYPALRARIDGWQRGVTAAGYEVKQWSRHSLLAIALEDAGVRPSALVDTVLDRYFAVMTAESRVYPDAAALVDALRAGGVSFHLATNSDGFLRFAGATFVYDPADAYARKLARLAVLRDAGIERAAITVGDPVGKPAAGFYEQVLRDFGARLGARVDRARTLAVGDSLTSDVLPLLALGVGHGAWLQRWEQGPAPPAVPVVRSLAEVHALVWR